MFSLWSEPFGNLYVLSAWYKSMNLDECAYTALKICSLSFWQVRTSIKFQIFTTLTVGKLLLINVFYCVEHFVQRMANNEKLLRRLGNSKRIIEAFIEKAVLSVKPQNLLIIERVRFILVNEVLIFVRHIHFLGLWDKHFFGSLHVSFIFLEIDKTVNIVSVSD